MSQAISAQRNSDTSSNAVAQGTLQGAGVVANMGEKLMGARLKAPVRMGKGERDVFEAPVRIQAGADGVSKAMAQIDTTKVKAGSGASKALTGVKVLGRGLVAVGATLDIMDISRSVAADKARGDGEKIETKKAIGRVAGGWGGAIGGAAAGAAAVALLPFGGPIAGMVIGSIVGGIGGHIAGEKVMS